MKFITIIFVIVFSKAAIASQIAGGNITFKPTAVPNEYEFTANIYKDCGSNLVDSTLYIQIKDDCGTTDTAVLLDLISGSEISVICASSIGNTSCALPTGGPLQGRFHYIYRGKYQLPSHCNAWVISTSIAQRMSANNVNLGMFYTESKLDNLNFPCNSSPYLANIYHVPYRCVGQNVILPIDAIDPNGDSLALSFVSALAGPGIPIAYNPPFTQSSPIIGIFFTADNKLSFALTAAGNYTVVILIEEFDDQGQFKGSILHDFQVVAEVCNNSSFGGNSNLTFDNNGSSASFSGDTIYMGSNDEFCLELAYTDANPSTTFSLKTNILNALPNATINATPGNPATIEVCWDYDPNYSQTSFSIEAMNNSCPVPGTASSIFHLALPNSVIVLPDTIPQCTGTVNSINFSCSGADLLGWKDLNGNLLDVGTDISCNPCNDPNFLFSADTVITAYDFNSPGVEQDVYIEVINTNLNVLDDSTFFCIGNAIVFSGPYPNYTETWTIDMTDFVQNSITIDSISPIQLYYHLNAQNHCFIDDSTIITPKKPEVFIYNVGNQLVSSAHTSYQWLFNNALILGETGQTHFPLNNGDYSVIGYDQWNCSDTSAIETITTAGLKSNMNQTKVSRFKQTLTVNSQIQNGTIEVFDIQGKLVLKSEFSKSVILELPNENQTFIVRVINASGEIKQVKKL